MLLYDVFTDYAVGLTDLSTRSVSKIQAKFGVNLSGRTCRLLSPLGNAYDAPWGECVKT